MVWICLGYIPGASPRRPPGECLQGRRPGPGVGQAREVPVGKPVSQSRLKFTRP